MFRPLAIALSGAVLLAACGSDSAAQQGPPVPPVPPSYSPPDNSSAPQDNDQRPPDNENAPPDNASAPPGNPQQPNVGGVLPPPPTPGGGTLPPQLIQGCKSLCSTLFGPCVEDCNDRCDDLSSISAACAVPAGFVITCYAQRASCNNDGDIELPRNRCQSELTDEMQVSEMCLDQLF
jgi:hypothetical protein